MNASALGRKIAAAAVLAVAAGVAGGAGPDAPRAGGTNRLIDSGSPYLLQHARNPVDWYPWGEEALERARRENKPIFLSVGYSSCYWCHVANRTLYSNPEIAALMNRWFVNVKVDREQRPDIDSLYMRATLLMTGSGGWPNNLFLTPDGKPFFGGSYFPPEDDDFGRPGFVTVLAAIHEDWRSRSGEIRARAEQVLAAMRSGEDAQRAQAGPARPGQWLREALRDTAARFDASHGGFRFEGRDSQFPQEPVLEMLVSALSAAPDAKALGRLSATLDAIALGGLHDHVGGGFHRYTVDRTWSVPHFEKMLYNNAQLLKVYARAWRLTRRPLYRLVASDIARYLERRMSAPEGGFYTAEDAEVDGHEGASYLWSEAEIEKVLGAEGARRLLRHYHLVPLPARRAAALAPDEERGALRVRLPLPEGTQAAEVLSRTAALRARLLAVRDSRPQPARDEKMIVGLNGMAIEALAAAGRIIGEPGYVRLARRAAERLWALAYHPGACALSHEIFRGRAQGAAFLDDYALFGAGLVALSDAGEGAVWRERALRLADDMLARFSRPDGSLATTPAERSLVMPPVESGDNPYPAGISAAIALLLRLGAEEEGTRFRKAAARVIASVRTRVEAQPGSWPTLVAAVASAPIGGSLAAAPTVPDTAAQVEVSGRVRAGPEHDEIVVAVRIASGYHVNANPASHDYLIPTEIVLDGLAPSRVAYPVPKLFRPAFARSGIKVYDGEVSIVAKLPKGALRSGRVISGVVSAQACNDEVCLPPAKLPLRVQAGTGVE